MTLDITQIIVALAGLLASILTAVAIPWLRAKIGAQRWEQLQNIVTVVVYAAEQLAGTTEGKKLIALAGSKLSYATQRVNEALNKAGITYDPGIIRAAIEAAVLGIGEGMADIAEI